LAREDGFTTMAELARKNSVPFVISPLNTSRPMTYDWKNQSLGHVRISRVQAGNYRAERTDVLARESSEPRLILQAPEGPVAQEQNGHRVEGVTGSLVLMWSLSALRTEMREPAFVNAIDVPLDAVGLPHRMLRDLVGRDLGSAPLGRAVTAFLRELVHTDLAAPGLESAAAPTMDLVRAVIALASGDDFASRDPLGQTIGTRLMLYLRSHLSDADLTADTVAAKFSISRRYLYVILNKMGVSLGEWVRTERLIAAATALRDPGQTTIPVSNIARRVGFADHSTFSRAFRAEYGCSPSEWRAAVLYSNSG
jgi:AraC-like DNA-binding protein